MHPGFGLPALALSATVLTVALEARRSQEASLKRLNAERLARYGRWVMDRQRMVVAWAVLALSVVCVLFNALMGSPAWWLWLVVTAAQAGDVGMRARSRARYLSFISTQNRQIPVSPSSPTA